MENANFLVGMRLSGTGFAQTNYWKICILLKAVVIVYSPDTNIENLSFESKLSCSAAGRLFFFLSTFRTPFFRFFFRVN